MIEKTATLDPPLPNLSLGKAAMPQPSEQATAKPEEVLAQAALEGSSGLVGWGNNEDGQLLPVLPSSANSDAKPGTSNTQASGVPVVATNEVPGLSPRVVAKVPKHAAVGGGGMFKGHMLDLPQKLDHFGNGRRVVGVSCG
jgi:hypothetical protein